jgi:hypothetical protein
MAALAPSLLHEIPADMGLLSSAMNLVLKRQVRAGGPSEGFRSSFTSALFSVGVYIAGRHQPGTPGAHYSLCDEAAQCSESDWL